MAKHSKKVAEFMRTQGVRYVAWGAMVLVLVLVLVWVTTRTWSAATSRSEFTLGPQSLTVRRWPSYLQADRMLQELRAQTKGVLSGRNAFDPDICPKVEHVLRTSPWVTDVRGVYRTLPNCIEADLVFRQPAGVVLAGNKRFLVDADGVWLPALLYQKPKDWTDKQPPVIVSRKMVSHPQTGRPLDGRSLAVGARLSTYLMKEEIFEDIAITRIDVTNVGKRSTDPEVILFTESGVAVKWGTTDAYESIKGLGRSPEENSDAQKLQMLKSRLDEYPDLKGLEYIDLRFDKVFFRPTASAKL